jgi:hypothetical protein
MSWARSLLWQTGLPRVSSAVRSYRAISAHIDETRHLYPHLKLTYHPSSSNEPPGVMPDMLSFTRYITPLQSRRVQRCRILGRAIGVMSGLLTFLRCRVVATDSRCCLVSGRALHECVHRSQNRHELHHLVCTLLCSARLLCLLCRPGFGFPCRCFSPKVSRRAFTVFPCSRSMFTFPHLQSPHQILREPTITSGIYHRSPKQVK